MSETVTISAPFAGIMSFHVEEGAAVQAGQTIGQLEAVKISTPVVSPTPGTLHYAVAQFADVSGGDTIATVS